MIVYCDSTFVIGLYVAIDTHSLAALKQWERLGCPQLLFTPLPRLEVRNAVRQFEFTSDLKAHQVKEVFRNLEQDLADGTLVHENLDWTNTLRQAEQIGSTHTRTTGVRAMDLLHVAAAVELSADMFLTFDERQFRTAKAAGLKAVFPGGRSDEGALENEEMTFGMTRDCVMPEQQKWNSGW